MTVGKLIITAGLLILLAVIGQLALKETASSGLAPTIQSEGLSVYHADPEHIWNRLFQQFYSRVSQNGERYGPDTLDPPLWVETRYLLEGVSYEQALMLLDEFLTTNAASLVNDPLKRAFFQRDMWAVFDWLAIRPDDHPVEREALQSRLVQVIQQVALSPKEVETLPDNYQDAVGMYPAAYQPDQPETAYLPPDLFDPSGNWVNVGRKGGPAAMTHVGNTYFNGRSIFLVFLRLPDGRQSTLEYLQALREAPTTSQAPVLPAGSQVALARQMLVINDQGEITPTSVTLSIQLRHFRPAQDFFQFELYRSALFEEQAGGMHPVMPGDLKYIVFGAHDVDYFEQFPEAPEAHRVETLNTCNGCHLANPQRQGSNAILSVITYSRDPFPLPDEKSPVLVETKPNEEAAAIVAWKLQQATWEQLRVFWQYP